MMTPTFQAALIAAKIRVREAKKEMNMTRATSIDTTKIWEVIMEELRKPSEEEK